VEKIEILKASLEDAAKILELQKIAYQSEAEINQDWNIPPLTQSLPQIIAEFDTKVFLKGVVADRIVGSVRASLDNCTCAIGRLIVHPDYQGKGIGTRLMQKIEMIFSDAKRFELFTGSKSRGNIRFYQRLGYNQYRLENLTPTLQLVFLEKHNQSSVNA
jgi:GNAT superfamily N-acetyltransferase